MSEAKEFLGRGWRYPICLDFQGRVATSAYEDDIKESIRIILGTSPGERIMRPDFGCGIVDMVFMSLDSLTLGMLESQVIEALLLWEPRIELDKVEAAESSLDQGLVEISISYRVISTNNQFNLVYPFYLKE